ncbi:MAG: DUF1146 domain-containing protein [Erysipelothrix sp.]|nr:DUF1146 domain-containing protein [Erysipelothrix sp.]
MGLSSPNSFLTLLLYLVFMVLSFLALEGLDYSKILRKPYQHRALLLQLLLSLALAYLSTNFFLVVMFSA